jgi:hypothetical protein
LATSLTKAIESFVQAPVARRKSETVGYAHVDFFIERCVKISSFDIELANFEVIESGNTEESADGIPTSDRGESESKILARDLCEAFGDKASFKTRNCAGFVAFDMENPFALNCFTSRWEIVNLFIDAFCLERE